MNLFVFGANFSELPTMSSSESDPDVVGGVK